MSKRETRNVVVVMVAYDGPVTDELLEILQETQSGYAGVVGARAFVGTDADLTRWETAEGQDAQRVTRV